MRRSSAILLWTSLALSTVGSIVQAVDVALLYSVIHRAAFTAVTDPDGQLPRNTDTYQLRYLDFAGGTVIHISPDIFLAVLPLSAWLLVRIRERAALKTRLGHAAAWAMLVYVVVSASMIVWLESFVTH